MQVFRFALGMLSHPASVSYLPTGQQDAPQWRPFGQALQLRNGLTLTAPATWGLSPRSIYAAPDPQGPLQQRRQISTLFLDWRILL